MGDLRAPRVATEAARGAAMVECHIPMRRRAGARRGRGGGRGGHGGRPVQGGKRQNLGSLYGVPHVCNRIVTVSERRLARVTASTQSCVTSTQSGRVLICEVVY